MSTTKSLVADRLQMTSNILNSDSNVESIISTTEKTARTIRINRPKHLNTINVHIVNTMIQLLKDSNVSENVGMVIIEGEGRAFSAGADIRDIGKMSTSPSGIEQLGNFISNYGVMLNIAGTLKKPLITIMDGITIGSACGLSSLSFFSIATENTQVSFPETRIGHFCDVGANFVLSRLNGNIGKYLALTATTIRAEDVYFSGLATHFVPSNQLDSLKKDLIRMDHPNYKSINSIINKYTVKQDHVPTMYTLHGEKRKIINKCFQYNTVAEILDSLEKEGSTFSIKTIHQIRQASPISIALTLEQLRIGSTLSLSESFLMEINSWKVAPFVPDFQKGVSSILLKKAPQWSYSDHSQVDFQKDILDQFMNTANKQTLTGEERHDYFEQYRAFGLPSQHQIGQLKEEYTNEEIVTWFVSRYNKFGVRQEVEEILNKNH